MEGIAEDVAAANENKLPEDLRTLTVYPEPYMTHEQVKHGGFVLYVAGKCFFKIFKLILLW